MDAVEEIKSRLSIEDVVGRTVDLRRSGASLKGLCPFHEERTPSFYVSPARGTYHCFGCGKGGDIFSFVMETGRVAFPEALKELSEQAGVTLPERERQTPSIKNRLYEINAAAVRFFSDELASGHGVRARRYLESRHFGAEAIEMFSLGYAPNGRDGLMTFLKRAGFDEQTALAAGLAISDDAGGPVRDRFRTRLIFPIQDTSGRTLGFGGRALEGDQQPKYLNSPQTEIFDKSTVLFGINLASDSLKSTKQAVLVEGYLDAARAHLAGFSNVVASLGTAVTAKQLTALDRMTEQVILALDPDPAGQSAAARTSLSALAELRGQRARANGTTHLQLRIARFPEGAGDPDELIREAPEVWRASIESSIPAFEFYFEQTMSSLDRSNENWKEEAINRLMPPIRQLSESAAWQATWIQRLADAIKIEPQLLLRSMPSARHPTSGRAAARTGVGEIVQQTTSHGMSLDSVESKERSLLTLLLKMVILPDETLQRLRGIGFQRPEHAAILDHLLRWQPSQNYDYDYLREDMEESLREYADDLRAQDSPLPDDGKFSVAVDLHLTRIRHANVDVQYRRASKVLEEMAAEDRAAALVRIAELIAERRALDEQLEALSIRSGQGKRAL